MRKLIVGLFGAITLAAIVLLLGSFAFAEAPTIQTGHTQGDDSNPSGPPEVVIPKMYQPIAPSAPQALTSTVYFTPQDENTSTTVLFLYNTSNVAGTVNIQAFYLDGSMQLNANIAVPPNGLVRICADPVSTISASWANYVLVNFRTYSTYAKMTLPAGVKADGYVAWNTSGTYDPLASLQTLPLRFSSDPATVFMPSVPKGVP